MIHAGAYGRIMRALIGVGAAALLAVGLMSGCSGSDEDASQGLSQDAVVSYAYHDSSVPPQYHRSESLTVTQGEAHLVIDSYGDVLADERVPTPTAVWDLLGSTLPSVEGLEAQPDEDDCTGGTGIDLVIASGEETFLDLRPQFCGGTNEALQAPIQTWIAPARELFPPTDELAPEGE